MTTIAYRNGVMAADTLTTGGDIRRGATSKIIRLQDGTLVGVSGAAGILGRVAVWFENAFQKDAIQPEFEDFPKLPARCEVYGIAARPNGMVCVFSIDGICQWVDTDFVATGSGNELAMGAMAMGASAREAVAVAAQFDVYTGGKIETLSVGSPSRPTEEDQL